MKGSGGRLGRAIYFADTITKSLQYSFYDPLLHNERIMVALAVETKLGKAWETTMNLQGLPKGFDSVLAIGNVGGFAKEPITFSDGPVTRYSSAIPTVLDKRRSTITSMPFTRQTARGLDSY
jgi:hypothetical protein